MIHSDKVQKVVGKLTRFMRLARHVSGILILALGESILHLDNSFYYISRKIEQLFVSKDFHVKVIRTEKDQLFVRFIINVSSIKSSEINWDYMITELMLCLGATKNDFHFGVGEKNEVFIDITTSAIARFEKIKKIRKGDDRKELDSLVAAAQMITDKEGEISVELLHQRLDISYEKALWIINEMVKTEAIAPLKKIRSSKLPKQVN